MNGKIRLLLWSMIICIISTISATAQNLVASGTVTDAADNQPIPGVAIMVKGTTTGTVTDYDGKFSINANQGDQLIFSFIGYATVEQPAAANMSVSLESDAQDLEDVVVIGYGVARKNDLTGSVTAIKPDELNHGMTTNAQDMISGKIAGVNVTSASGSPGAGATIRIRGGSSLNASNDPLIVIDGLAMDNDGVKGLSNPLSMVNPADIETFTVLKDASATAIYGSRGSNGVIIITTKKGAKNSRPQIAYNGSVGLSLVRENDLIEVMDGNEYREFIANLFGTDSNAYALLGDANTDWQDEIYREAWNTDHNVTLSGGTQNLQYRVSVGYTGQEGILDTSDFRRGTVSVNLSPSFLDDHLTFNINAKGMYAKTWYANTDAIGAALWMDPTQPIKSDDSKYANFGGYFQWTTDGTSLNDPNYAYNIISTATANPVALIDQKDDKATSKSIIGNVEGNYKIHNFEDLAIHGNFGWDVSTGKQTTKISNQSYSNFYTGWDGWEKIDKYNLSINAYLQYVKDFNEANNLNVMAGYEWQHFHSETESDGCGYYPETNNDASLAGTEYGRSPYKSKTEHYLVSFFGRLGYSLLDRYMLTATVRYDGSSRFKDHWDLFPAFAFAWRAKQETFLRDVDVLTDLKVRLGWGKTGQQEGIGDYNYFATYSVSSGDGKETYPLVGDGTLNRPDAYNEDLSWETTTTYNVGLDLAFLDSRISFTGDFYYRETEDLINTVYVAAGSNFRNQVTSNIGKLENTGVELALTLRPIQTKDWQWELTLNGAYNDNEITELTGEGDDYYVATGGISAGTGNYCQAHKVGSAASSFYVYQQVYGEDGKPIEGLVVDRNADGQINSSDLYIYKQPTAPWTMGLSSRLQWRNIDFGFSLRGNIGNYVYNDNQANMGDCSASGIYAQSVYLGNRPKYVLANNFQSSDLTTVLSDYYVQNASFLKCDNITLGYSFKKIASLPLKGRVYATCSNVFTITNYDGVDPEVSGGIDNNIYPRPITTQIGLSLNF